MQKFAVERELKRTRKPHLFGRQQGRAAGRVVRVRTEVKRPLIDRAALQNLVDRAKQQGSRRDQVFAGIDTEQFLLRVPGHQNMPFEMADQRSEMLTVNQIREVAHILFVEVSDREIDGQEICAGDPIRAHIVTPKQTGFIVDFIGIKEF